MISLNFIFFRDSKRVLRNAVVEKAQKMENDLSNMCH